MRISSIAAWLMVSACPALCQQTAPAGSNWQRVEQLPAHSRVHVAADKGGRVCTIYSVSDDALVCSTRMGDKPGQSFQRAAIKSIKLTRYTISSVAGTGIGAGAGALIGFAAVRPNPNAFLQFPGIERGIIAVGGGLAGLAIGGPTDFLRGPTIYVRP
jgi:hypothetical protein